MDNHNLFADIDKEPTSEETQKIAIRFLRDQARSAHASGDGILVNHLSSIAISQTKLWITDNKCHITLYDIKWAIIFILYWLCYDFYFFQINEILNKLPKSEKEKNLSSCLHILEFLVQEPIINSSEKVRELKQLNFSCFIDENSDENDWNIEDDTFLTYSIELIYIRNKCSSLWLDYANHLKNTISNDHHKKINHLISRLKSQAYLLESKIEFSFLEKELDVLQKEEKELFNAWKLFLNCKKQELSNALDDMAAKYGIESVYYLSIFALHHCFPDFFRERDPQQIGLSRRLLSASSRFGAYENLISLNREQIFYEKSSQLWHENITANANTRIICFRLALLNEINSLRNWNLLGWIDAAKQYAYASQEVIRQYQSTDKDRLIFAKLAFENLLLCRQLKEKDQASIKLSYILDDLDEHSREDLAIWLIELRPMHWYHVLSAFFLLSDSLPSKLLPEIAKWCLRYDEQSIEDKVGSRLDWMNFWGDIIGCVNNSDEICSILYPIFQKISKNPYIIKIGDGHDLFVKFLMNAQLMQAFDVADRMLEINAKDDERFSNIRWFIFYSVAKERAEFADRYRGKLLDIATTPVQKMYTGFIDIDDYEFKKIDDEGMRSWIREKVLIDTNEIINRDGKTFPMKTSIGQNLIAMIEWPDTEENVINELIKSLNSEHITPNDIGRLLLYLSEFLSSNPDKIFPLIQQDYYRWFETLPQGHDPFPNVNEPFSSFRINSTDDEFKIAAFINLTGEICNIDNDNLREKIALWLTESYLKSPTGVLPNIFVIAIQLGVNSTYITETELSNIVMFILYRALSESDNISENRTSAVRLIRQIANLMNSEITGMISMSNVKNIERLSIVLNHLEALIPTYCEKNLDPELRAVTAELLVNWKNNLKLKPSENLIKILDSFKNDARARVRFSATQ